MRRSTRLERYLEDCSYDVLSNPTNMDEVDMSTTPTPIAELFYRAGDGNYPEDQDAYFQPPKQDPFAEAVYMYCRKHADDTHPFREEVKDAWLQRCKKAWASLVRDVHFAYLAFEANEDRDLWDEVRFDLEADLKRGADLIIEDDGQTYHVNLFIDSQKSQKFLDKKKGHRQPEKQAIDLEVPMTFDGVKKSIKSEGDDIWLFNHHHIKAVELAIKRDDKTEFTRNGTTLCKVRG